MKLVFTLLFFLLNSVLLNAQSFSKIDSVARHTTAAQESSLKDLVAYLSSQCNSQQQQARILFTWVATHVQYDYESFFKHKKVPADSKWVLTKRNAQCSGYSNLLKEMCTLAQLPCETIDGYARDYTIKVINTNAIANHSWNAIKVNNEWQLMDVTWAASHLQDGKKVVNEFNDFWFNTSPSAFIYTHFPKVNTWQLLAKPLSAAAVNQLNMVSPIYFKLGVDAPYFLANNLLGKIDLPTIYLETEQVKFTQFPIQKNYTVGDTIRFGIIGEADMEYAFNTNAGIQIIKELNKIEVVAVKGSMHFMKRNINDANNSYAYVLSFEGI